MSQENVDIVRRIWASLTQGDDEWRGLVAPDCEFDFSRRLLDPFVARGRDDPALASALADTDQHWEGGTFFEPVETLGAGDKVFSVIRTGGRGRASGIEVEAEVATVATMRDGVTVRVVYFGDDRQAALEAAGLSE
jgi:ketosteroid isomerase-like protein